MSLQESMGTEEFQGEVGRPLANFLPDAWGDYFLHYSPQNEDVHAKKKQEHEILKGESRRVLLNTTKKQLEYLKLVDIYERLGVSYHYEQVIEETLRNIYIHDKDNVKEQDDIDIYYTSLKFRILRQHGYYATSDMFKKYVDGEGNFMESLKDDITSMLSLYEATHVRHHGEDILEKALEFTKNHLKLIVNQSNHPLVPQIARALKYPNQRGVIRLESRHYISFYEQDPCHNESLLRFAKLDFDLLQSLHQEELEELTTWKTKTFDFSGKYYFARDRLAEAHFFSVGVFLQPHFSVARKIFTKAFLLLSVGDDIYDSFGIMEELESLTDALERCNDDCIDSLVSSMRDFYKVVRVTFESFEDELNKLGRKNYVDYLRREWLDLCKSYVEVAKWRQDNYVPTFDEYMETSIKASAVCMVNTVSFLDNEFEESIARRSFEMVSMNGKPQRAASNIGRLINDLVDYEFDKQKEHFAGGVDCYIKQYGVTFEEACLAINICLEDAWKDIAEEMCQPTTPIPKPLLGRIHNFCRTLDYVYKYDDGYTEITERMKSTLTLLFVKPVW